MCQAFGFQCNANKHLTNGKQDTINPQQTVQQLSCQMMIVLKCKLKQVPREPKQLLHLNVLVRAMTAITVVWTEPAEYAECSK